MRRICTPRYVECFEEFQKKGQGLLLWGDVGTGKTFLAGCIANALMDRNIPVLMTSFPKLKNALGGLYNGERNEYLQSLNRYKLLIIDDVGVERDTSYVLETVYLVIDRIMEGCTPIAFSGRNYRTDRGRTNRESVSGILREMVFKVKRL